MVYGCDGPWWRARNGLPDFAGLKLAYDADVCASYQDVHKVEVLNHDRMLFDTPGTVGSGGNSGFQAVNIAAQFGAVRILLIGFDMHTGGGLHWYGNNTWPGARNPAMSNFMRWRDAFEKRALPELRRRRIEVVNASPDSALVCFPHKTVERALEDWGL